MCMVSMSVLAQPGGNTGGGDTGGGSSSSTDAPDGAYYILSDGSTVTKSGETLSTSTSDYNVVQVTNGTLTMTNCTLTKTGDTSRTDGDATSFYGTNSALYVGSSTGICTMTGGTITTNSKGSNAAFSYNGGQLYISGVTIHNYSNVSRGLHATYGGYITASDMNITTEGETSSTIATDRGGGTVSVDGGTATAQGNNSAILYSTGTITASNLTGISEQGEIGVVEGDNTITITSCDMTSGSSKRAFMMLQSGSGDAEGSNAAIACTSSTLTVTGTSTPLCEVPTLNTGTLTLTDCTLSVASGVLMYVDYNTQWSTYGGTGNLILQTTQDSWSYTGAVKADSYSNVTVTVGDNVTWNGSMDSDNTASSANVTVNEGGQWNLTANSYVSTLVNNGTIYLNGYTLTYDTLTGNSPLNEEAGVTSISTDDPSAPGNIYNVYGQIVKANATDFEGLASGVYIKNGKKFLIKNQ